MQPSWGVSAVPPSTPGARAGTAGLRRSADLLRAFRVEQTDPARFHGLLARDSVRMAGEHGSLAIRSVDVCFSSNVVEHVPAPWRFADELVDARPRYLPAYARPLLRVPGLREVATWNLWLVLRRR